MSTWTADTIRALGPATDLPTLGSIFACSRWKAYEMARTGKWETVGVKIVRLGSTYRVMVVSILDVLGYGDAASSGASGNGIRNDLLTGAAGFTPGITAGSRREDVAARPDAPSVERP